MNGYRKVLAVAAALAFGLGLGVAGAATTAGAAGSQDYCPADRLCLWFNSNYAGARADFRQSDNNLSNELFNDGPAYANGWLVQVENNAASFHNRSGNKVTFYDARNCNIDYSYREVAPGAQGNFGDALKNRVSSIFINMEGGCVNVDQSDA
jgi:hypothetical protein